MFEFDFEDLGSEGEADASRPKVPGPAQGRSRGAFSSSVGQVNGKVETTPAKAKAKPKAKAKVQHDPLAALAAQEAARAAEMLAKLAPSGYSAVPAIPEPSLAPQMPVEATKPVPPTSRQKPKQDEPPMPKQQTERPALKPKKLAEHPVDEDEAAYRAAAEAAAERALERDRNSDWWKKLQTKAPKHRVERCDRLPIHRESELGDRTTPLPTRGFKVVAEVHPVRSQPCAGALVCGGRKLHETIRAVEETFDGWVKLAGDEGWMCQGVEEAPLSMKCLEALEKPRAMAVETLAKIPGRQMLEVVADDGVDILQEPVEGALVLGRRSFGEFLLADSQTYHGWIRLSDNEGWAQAVSGSGERILIGIRPDELQLTTTDGSAVPEESPEQTAAAVAEAARKEALRQLESAALSGNSAFFCAALEVARQRGVSKKDIAKANAMRS